MPFSSYSANGFTCLFLNCQLNTTGPHSRKAGRDVRLQRELSGELQLQVIAVPFSSFSLQCCPSPGNQETCAPGEYDLTTTAYFLKFTSREYCLEKLDGNNNKLHSYKSHIQHVLSTNCGICFQEACGICKSLEQIVNTCKFRIRTTSMKDKLAQHLEAHRINFSYR